MGSDMCREIVRIGPLLKHEYLDRYGALILIGSLVYLLDPIGT